LAVEQIRYLFIVIHHSASGRWATVKDIRKWHEKNRQGIGYHYVIEGDGAIKTGRNLRIKGAHCRGEGNKFGIGICIVGDNTKEEDKWTYNQISAGKKLVTQIKSVIPNLEIYGHSDFWPTECPGFDREDLRRMFSYNG
jgi:N-acetyl-anhydromuramyl-L-alanine amidase AmpD